MSIDLTAIIKKGTDFAKQATDEDKAGNFDIAADAYMAAAEWFIHATKYGAMNDQMKQEIRRKVKTYIERAEKIKGTADQKPPENQPASSKPTRPREEEKDPDKMRMKQKFEGAIVTNPEVTFDDVVGLEQAKTALKEAVILPIKFPKLFRDKRKPWAGILLYGPPGTGKSYLAKAIATECKSTFISVSSADLLSKWVGESEKGVQCLFEIARDRRPCIVFIDEIDAICGQRTDSQSEAATRVLNEFLGQMDGVGKENAGVLILAATNIPWALDTAIRRRYEKRIYIPLPEINERRSMFKLHLGTSAFHTIKDDEWMQLAQRSENYSGADIAVVCREALLRPIRRLSSATHFKRISNPNKDPNEPTHVWLACSPGDPAAEPLTLDKINPDELCEPPVTMSDMLAALSTQKSTVGEDELVKYRQFTEVFGQEVTANETDLVKYRQFTEEFGDDVS